MGIVQIANRHPGRFMRTDTVPYKQRERTEDDGHRIKCSTRIPYAYKKYEVELPRM